jgi:hypothetical protein
MMTPCIWMRYDDRVALAVTPVADARWLAFDMLLDSDWFATFQVHLVAADGAIIRQAQVAPLTRCQTRIALAMDAVPWERVARAELRVARTPEFPVRCAVSTITLSSDPPPALIDSELPAGPLLDPFGQSTLHDHPTKTRNEAELRTRLTAQRNAVVQPIEGRSRWGGWLTRRVKATGFFRTHHDDRRWWLVDPDGYLFWSAGADCVNPTIDHETRIGTSLMRLEKAVAWLPPVEWADCHGTNPYHAQTDVEIHYMIANFIRVFGVDGWREAWRACAHGEFRRIGFNTAGDWSDEAAASASGLPYARPLELGFRFPHAPEIAAGFPDPFAPGVEEDAAAFAEQLLGTRDDPALLGYFLHNEPAWHGHGTPPAEAMLTRTETCDARRALAAWLRDKYGDRLPDAWDGATLAQIEHGRWAEIPAGARADLEAFSTVMMERLCRLLGDACRRVDPHHLNLGVRWWSFPPVWALRAMGSFDVVSFNYYEPRVALVTYGNDGEEPGACEALAALHRPALIGEWHFGSLDGGLPSAGLYRVRDQVERGKAYRVFLEQAAALPWMVGTHWFNFYDRNALYWLSSNENYNIGFLDICHAPHPEICRAAQRSHARLYDVAAGLTPPFDESVEYLFPSR